MMCDMTLWTVDRQTRSLAGAAQVPANSVRILAAVPAEIPPRGRAASRLAVIGSGRRRRRALVPRTAEATAAKPAFIVSRPPARACPKRWVSAFVKRGNQGSSGGAREEAMSSKTKSVAAGDPFVGFKAVQREAWALFAPLEAVTMVPAAKLVKFAGITAGQRVLDVACGTGVVTVTAARRGASASGLDLSPVLLERARRNAEIAGVTIDFTEGDVEALPYADASFDVVTSQFGHIFAPRPAIAIGEMLRVLKPGGTIAFNTWPPELFVGKQIDLLM